jgi:hypothetical protein
LAAGSAPGCGWPIYEFPGQAMTPKQVRALKLLTEKQREFYF